MVSNYVLFGYVVILVFVFSACKDRISEPKPIEESCEQMSTCERALIGPVEAFSNGTDGKVSTIAKIAGEEVISLEWIARGDSIDLIITLPERPPLDAMVFDVGLPTLANANKVAAVIIGLNNYQLRDETNGGSIMSLLQDSPSVLDHGSNHAGCDKINNWPLIGSCSDSGICCDLHDACIDTNCEPPFGNLLACLKDLEGCMVSPSCINCHQEAIICYLISLDAEFPLDFGPSYCCNNIDNENDCGKPQQCIIPGEPPIVETDPCKCPEDDRLTPCEDDPNPSPGNSSGDVHIRTPDGLAYDFQGAGEYLLIESDDGSIVVQARQEPWSGSNRVSVNTAVAANVAGDRIGVYVNRSPNLYVNGAATTLNGDRVEMPNGGMIYDLPSGYIFSWPSGFQMSVKVRGKYMDIGISPPDNSQESFSGLLGNLNGIADDDFQTRSGQSLSTSVEFNTLYKVFGDSWRIRQSESLFDYKAGNSTDTYSLVDFPGSLITADDLDPADYEAARQTCEAAGITDPMLLKDCILDIAITGDNTFAESAAESRQPDLALEVTPSLPTEGLIAYYPFNNNANDESGNGNDGTVSGAKLTTDRFGNENSAYQFDGTNDYISSDPELPVSNEERSISLWFNTTSSSGSNGWFVNTMASWGAPTNNNLCALGIYQAKLMFGAFGTPNDVYTDKIVNDGNWHHAVVTYDGSTIKIFLDEVEVAAENRSLDTVNSNLNIGRRINQANQFMDGLVDDIRVYDRVLSEKEIELLYHEGSWDRE